MRSIVDWITPHVHHLLSATVDHGAVLAAAERANALASADDLRRSSPVLRALVADGHVVIVAALYDLATGIVTFLDG